jgi:hypothetical protein
MKDILFRKSPKSLLSYLEQGEMSTDAPLLPATAIGL